MPMLLQYGLPLVPRLEGTMHTLEAAESHSQSYLPMQLEVELFRGTCSDLLVDVMSLGLDASKR